MLILDRQGAVPPYVVQLRVIWAIILRDIRTRFFGHGLGYLVAIAWPIAHLFIALITYQVSGRIQPVGDSLALFFATALVPYFAFSYFARFIMQSMANNKPLLNMPVVKITDIVFARVILEFLASCCMTLVIITMFFVVDINVVPRDLSQAFSALACSMLLGLGIGVVNAMIVAALPAWNLGYALLQMVLYISSGVMFMPDLMPEPVRYGMSFNPIFHGVEWMRSAYYEGYAAYALDKGYLIAWGVGSLFVGLLTERMMRGRILQG